jgi:hypothetical protein
MFPHKSSITSQAIGGKIRNTYYVLRNYLRAHGQLAVYYFPSQDVRMEWLKPAAPGSPVTEQGEGPWPDPPQPAKVYTVLPFIRSESPSFM